MVAVEIVLIIIGVIFLIGSFFVSEKLSQKDIEQISMMSEADLKQIAEKQVKNVKVQVENLLEEVIDETVETTKRGLEKETNEKIMAVSEYSDTVIESINKTHNEIIFLYSMLNDKHAETAEIVGDLQRYAKQIREFDVDEVLAKIDEAVKQKKEDTTEKKTTKKRTTKKKITTNGTKDKTPNVDDIIEEPQKKEELLNKNEQILLLHKEGLNQVEIAKKLDCGLGEVKLVLGLYNED